MVLTGGDWPYLWPLTINSLSHFPSAWDNFFNFGLGNNSVFSLWIMSYLNFTSWLAYLIPSWTFISTIFWILPSIFSSFIGAMMLWRKCFSRVIYLEVFTGVIYLCNSYFLMVFSGGQFGFALAYSLIPWCMLLFFDVFNLNGRSKIKALFSKKIIVFSLSVSLLLLFDVRVAYVLIVCLLCYLLVLFVARNKERRKILEVSIIIFVLSGIFIFFIHSFWLLPVLLAHKDFLQQLGSAYSSISSVKFFSFAKFENTISLLHPTWPENIFGKVGFMRPEFLIIPILAFVSLLFVQKETKERRVDILAFALIGLVGAFLAKGANAPFGGIYLWAFQHVPGFIMFRDPTKWYVMVAISYSVLIPYSIWKIYRWLQLQSKFQSSILQCRIKIQINPKAKIFNLQNLFVILFIIFWLFTIRQAVFGQLGGTFKTTNVPSDYVKLEQFLSSQKSFSRTFWVPATQRFGFYSSVHPRISAQEYLNNYTLQSLVKQINRPQTEMLLQESGVKYVIVPYDSQGEIFLTDRKYDDKKYLSTIDAVKKIAWLHQLKGFGKIAVFEVPNPKNHFWSPSQNLRVNYKFINPTQYVINVSNARKGDKLVFSESFDKEWQLLYGSSKIASVPFGKLFNSFILPRSGDYKLTIYYAPQKWVNIGVVISILSLLGVLSLLFFIKVKSGK